MQIVFEGGQLLQEQYLWIPKRETIDQPLIDQDGMVLGIKQACYHCPDYYWELKRTNTAWTPELVFLGQDSARRMKRKGAGAGVATSTADKKKLRVRALTQKLSDQEIKTDVATKTREEEVDE